MDERTLKRVRRERRKWRVRNRVRGTAARPRLTVYRSLRALYAQIVDDDAGRTLVGLSTHSPALRPALQGLKKTEAAKRLGERIAELARERGITRVVFDRGPYRYHGRVRAAADGARERGLNF